MIDTNYNSTSRYLRWYWVRRHDGTLLSLGVGGARAATRRATRGHRGDEAQRQPSFLGHLELSGVFFLKEDQNIGPRPAWRFPSFLPGDTCHASLAGEQVLKGLTDGEIEEASTAHTFTVPAQFNLHHRRPHSRARLTSCTHLIPLDR